jgi:hypothetical protein
VIDRYMAVDFEHLHRRGAAMAARPGVSKGMGALG